MKAATRLAILLATNAVAAAAPVVPGIANHPEIGARSAGAVLLTELNCTACHAAESPLLQPKGGPVLDAVAGRVQRDYLEAFIADPAATKPGTTMPGVLDALPAAERLEVAGAIADYLSSLTEAQPQLEPIDPQAVERGSETFHRVGCVACHSPEAKVFAGSPALHRLADKYSLASLTAFLEDPLATRPGGRMPDMKLDHFEALDVANYLLREQGSKATPPRETARAEQGRALFQKHGCAQCHSPGERARDFAPALDQLAADKACPSAPLPLSGAQREQLAAALREPPGGSPESALGVGLTLTRLNCIACHERAGAGGVTPQRDEYFTTSNLNLGEQARIPPTLTGVGAKLDPKWLRKVLVSGAAARPYMNTRMPRFGVRNVEPLARALPQLDTMAPAQFGRTADEKAARNAGFELAGNKNLSCVACHTWKGESATTLRGIELTTMAERLRENWFHHYMRNPQQFHPTTIMPNFWPAGKAVRPQVLGGDPGLQIDAIWQYLERGREARTPSGIRREPIEYGPADGRAVVLRRQYRGIGKRGIGVGYPAGINLAFDAAQLRLGSIWAGGFGEMSGVWRGQGSGHVHEQSREVARFPPGPAFALLATADAAWPELEEGKRPENLHFKGYALDGKGRPTLRYTFGDLAISDRFVDHADGPALTRSITFDEPAPDNLYLRLAADKDLEPAEAEHTFQLPHKLLIKAPPDARLRGTELLLPLGGKSEVTIDYTFKP